MDQVSKYFHNTVRRNESNAYARKETHTHSRTRTAAPHRIWLRASRNSMANVYTSIVGIFFYIQDSISMVWKWKDFVHFSFFVWFFCFLAHISVIRHYSIVVDMITLYSECSLVALTVCGCDNRFILRRVEFIFSARLQHINILLYREETLSHFRQGDAVVVNGHHG